MHRLSTIVSIFRVFSLLLLFTPGLSPAQEGSPAANPGNHTAQPVVLDVNVTVQASRRGSYYAGMVREIIPLKPGQRFDPERLLTSIEYLKQSRRFRDIRIETETRPQGIILQVHVTPFSIVKDIHFKGTYPLFEQDILNVMAIHVGDAYRESDLAAQEELIAELYRKKGYIDPQVNVEARLDPIDGLFEFEVIIEKGAHYVLGELIIKGNRAFSDAVLKRKLKTWRVSAFSFGRFFEERLKTDIKNLVTYYRGKKYADATVNYEVIYRQEDHRVDITLLIKEGQRYAIQIVGNQKFWNYTLKKDLLLFKSGNQRGLGIVKSIKAIRSRYHQAGYLETAIKVQGSKHGKNSGPVRNLTFSIHEGPRSQVAAIQIHGNHSVDTGTIRGQMLTATPTLFGWGAFVPETFEEDLFAVKALYLKYGFLNPRIEHTVRFSADKTRVTIVLQIEEGARTIIQSVQIADLQALPQEKARSRLRLKVGQPLRKYMVSEDEKILAALISEKGYPHVRVQGTVTLSEDQTRADITYRVAEGPRVMLGQIYMRGNLKTRDRILARELETEPGKPFSMRKIVAGQHNIRNLNAIHAVQFTSMGLKEKDQTVNLFMDIEEKKPYYLQIGGGFESDRKFFLRGKAVNQNLWGTNKNLWAGGEISEIGYRLESGLSEPRFLGSRFGADLNVFNESKSDFNQDFGTDTVGTSLGFSRKWFKHLTTALVFRYEYRNQFTVGPIDTTDLSQYEPRSILVTTPLIRYDARDSFMRPKNGYLGTFSVDISKGLENSLDDFYKYRLDIRYFSSPLEKLTFAFLGRAGHIDPFSSESNVPDDQLFFLGGTNDVRGFDENLLQYDEFGSPVGGRGALVGSLETRIDLGRSFELTFFYDTGRLWNTQADTFGDSFRSSIGTGLRYITPIGAVGLLYGHKLDPRPEEDPGRLHLSIGYTF